MKAIDYRKVLGIGFEDADKWELFRTKALNIIVGYSRYTYSSEEYLTFCNAVGAEYNWYYGNLYDVEKILKGKRNIEFLFCFVMFINTMNNENRLKKLFELSIITFLDECNIRHKVVEDSDGIFIVPEGAKELDDALVSAPLEWLKDFPETRKIYVHSLKQYSNGENKRDIADNFRKTLEEFLREFLNNEKDLNNNKSEICKHLKNQGADNNITNMLEPLLSYYKQLNDDKVKHKDTLDSKFLEFLMYQTGLFIRMIITAGK